MTGCADRYDSHGNTKGSAAMKTKPKPQNPKNQVALWVDATGHFDMTFDMKNVSPQQVALTCCQGLLTVAKAMLDTDTDEVVSVVESIATAFDLHDETREALINAAHKPPQQDEGGRYVH
jgi:hypothetical protein